jgi:hypothetical protein
MTSFVTDFETHAIWQGYVEDPAAKDFVVRKPRTIPLSKAQGSCHKTSNNQPYSRVWKSLGDSILELYCIAWLGLGHTRKCQFEDFCEKERYELCSVQRMFKPDTFGKRWEKESSPVVRLLPGFHECLALGNPRILCQKHGAHVQRTSLECQWYEKWDKKLDYRAAKKGPKKISK